MGHDKRVDWGMPAILGDDVDARTYYRDLQVTKSYSGILAARIFVGLPEVSFCTRDIFIAGTETIQVGVLPRRSIPPLTMVHEEGMLGCGDLCIYIGSSVFLRRNWLSAPLYSMDGCLSRTHSGA